MMNARELEARIKALHKAQATNEPASNIIALMESLKKEDVPTEEMLRVSRFPIRPPPAPSLSLLFLPQETCFALRHA